MKFEKLQKLYFNADNGAYSIVTKDERKKGQITITENDSEAALVVDHFGEDKIPRTGSKGNPLVINVRARNGTEGVGELTINFPKSKGNELRVYRKSEYGFDYEAGEVWFVFRRGAELVIGSLPENEWRSIGTNDSSDAYFQEEIEKPGLDAVPSFVEFSGRRIPRDPRVSRLALEQSGFICEYSGEPTPFISRVTGNPYLEAHHFIPLGLQDSFNRSLDCVENILPLNPLWHRAIHHAEPGFVRDMLDSMYPQRRAFLMDCGVDQANLVRLYGVEEIR
ncbi:hypothetical protein F7C95_05645 [Opitutia bacterium ISCC 51]|nr:hypothetical protein F7C95_05645 [Opitutae bacterium ISCC 51]QXD29449.1 hypothetical protein GA003_05615 [Opitutae bacterium ISCC 52]